MHDRLALLTSRQVFDFSLQARLQSYLALAAFFSQQGNSKQSDVFLNMYLDALNGGTPNSLPALQHGPAALSEQSFFVLSSIAKALE